MQNIIRRIDKRLLLTMLGIIIGTVGLYAAFHEPKAHVSATIINETNILDVHKPLEDLNISFRGKDIQEENLNLKIIALHIENNGEVNILQNYYDQNDTWGLKVNNGEIIEGRLANSNSDYIMHELKPFLVEGENVVKFEKIIFEKGNFFNIDLLILHEKSETPDIIILGKIAGVQEIAVTKSLVGEEPGFISKLIYGDALVHIARAVVYFFAFILAGFLIVIVIVAILGINDIIQRRKRKKQISRWEQIPADSNQKMLVDLYVNNGQGALQSLKTILENENRLRDAIARYAYRTPAEKRQISYKDIQNELQSVTRPVTARVSRVDEMPERHVGRRRYGLTRIMVQLLVESGIVNIQDDCTVTINSDFKEFLENLLKYTKD